MTHHHRVVRETTSFTATRKKYVSGVFLLALLGCEDALVRVQEPSTLTRPKLEIEVASQVPGDEQGGVRNTITIERAVLRARGWAVLYEGTCEDTSGRTVILGHVELSDSTYDTAAQGARADENEGTKIVASRTLRPNEPLCVMLHEDTGIQRDFEYQATSPFTFAGGTGLDKPLLRQDAVVAVTCHARVTPALVIQNQTIPSSQTMLQLERVVINGPGWVSVVQGSCDATTLDALVLGHAFVRNGESMNVALPLESPLSTTTTLCARLHYDSPEDGVFSFERIPEHEPPVTISVGEGMEAMQVPVMTTFEVSVTAP